MILEVMAHPGASRARVVWDGKVLQVWVAAPPHEGRANEAIVELVARAIGVPPSRIELLRGARGRAKVLRIDGVDPGVLDRLRGLNLG